ncbi:MAG: tyrosine-type recombinase/integrase [Nitrosomonas sp.]|uniref:tyrosine-type recombinase/integrase n=1 Tax=Nitrosomonas sp. TaxID=42353 RepID=UPI002733AFE1|nr:integrase arm-type DNA-binding domain-containing protein [Nitrosomonas sp.]MDP3663639.1 tyrosine-type recombinase/integrase [Nitrosomonas sp.]MDZ4105533.1 tyrosine-type recombinase/integrase [Nitrosomonas sp.]
MLRVTVGRLTDKACKAFVAQKAHGKEKTYSIGSYPAVSLAAARIELAEVKALLRENKDPVTQRRINRAESSAANDNTFEAIAAEWLKMKQREWSAGHYTKSARAFERDIYPAIGKLPIASITPAIVAKAIEDIYKRDVLETATRILQHLNGIFRYTQAKGLCRDNPALPARKILPRKKDTGRIPALLEFAALGDILRRADMARTSPSVRMAHRLCAFTAARIGNIINAEWKKFDLENDQPIWNIPRTKMKVKSRLIDHRIPLCPEIVSELRQWQAVFGSKGYVFPSPAGNKHIGRESIEKMYRVTLGLKGKHSPHGWRSSFSTLARAYDRGEQLSVAHRGATVIPIKTQAA